MNRLKEVLRLSELLVKKQKKPPKEGLRVKVVKLVKWKDSADGTVTLPVGAIGTAITNIYQMRRNRIFGVLWDRKALNNQGALADPEDALDVPGEFLYPVSER
jgi:hypothetical protein